MEYLDNYRVFEGRLMNLESIDRFPESLEKEHIKVVRNWLKKEGFNPDSFRVGEIPCEGIYYFERAVEKVGVDYFGVGAWEGKMTPIYTTLAFDENGNNCFDCKTIRESIDKTEFK